MQSKSFLILFLAVTCIVHCSYSQCSPQNIQLQNEYRSNTSRDNGFNSYSYGEDKYIELNDTLLSLEHIKSIWFGGLEDSIPRMGCGISTPGVQDFYPGPLNISTGQPYITNYCHGFPKIWKFSSEEIFELRNLFATNKLREEDLSLFIRSYPARNNKWYEDSLDIKLDENLAPFYDNDMDGNYDPMKGDYPIPIIENPDFIPHQFSYSVFNDVTESHSASNSWPIHVEIQQISYLMSNAEESILNKSLFTRFIWTLKGPYEIQNARLGIYELQELDVGIDDHYGIDTLSNCWYLFNKGTGYDYFTDNSHIRFTSCLNKVVDNYIVYNNPSIGTPDIETTRPDIPMHYINYLNGSWKDGTKLSIGGNGYNPGSTQFTNYAFHDLPKDSLGWSMETAEIPFGGFTTMSSFQLGDISNGNSGTLDMVDVIIYDQSTSGIDKVCELPVHSNKLKTFYQKSVIDGETTNTHERIALDEIYIYPNPCSSHINIKSSIDSEKITKLRVMDFYGRTICSFNGSELPKLDISSLQAGIYILQISTGELNSVKTFIKI